MNFIQWCMVNIPFHIFIPSKLLQPVTETLSLQSNKWPDDANIALTIYPIKKGFLVSSKKKGIIIFYCSTETVRLRLCSIPLSCLPHTPKVHGKCSKGSNDNVDLFYDSLDTGMNSFIRVKMPLCVFSTF